MVDDGRGVLRGRRKRRRRRRRRRGRRLSAADALCCSAQSL